MKREDLKALELSDEAIDQIMKLHGQDIEAHKTQAAEAEKQIESLQGQLEEAGKAIDGFKELDVDSIKAAADEWKAKAAEAQKEAESQIQQLKFDHALEGALRNAKAKDPDLIKAKLKLENLKLAEDGKIIDLDDQLKGIKENYDYLFESENPTPKIVTGGQNKKPKFDSVTLAAREAAGLSTE